MKIIAILILALMCTGCRTVTKALSNDFERKIGEITEAKVDQLVEQKLGKMIVDLAPEGIMGLVIAALGGKLVLGKKNGKNE